jgi:hypothetical protein
MWQDRPVAFPLGFSTWETHAKNARLLAELARQQSGNVAEEREERRRAVQATAADGRSLRGLPAIGRGVTGAIYGTNPEDAALSRQERRR